jgi:biotin transport system substrate-specific component
MSRALPLSLAVIGRESLLSKAILVLAGSAFIAVAAQISVPMVPVPMTLQTLAILMVGLTMGSRLGALTLLAYLAEGAAGLPVFANMSSGAALLGPSAGFLIGFVGMAFIAGLAADYGIRKFLPMALIALVAAALLYIPGVAWPLLIAKIGSVTQMLAGYGIDPAKWGADNTAMIWQYYMSPFLIGDAVKAVLAALIVAGGWAAYGRRAV